MPRHENVVNVDDIEWSEERHGDRFAYRRKWFTSQTGAKKLGCSMYRVPPGKTAFPFHRHFANEEAIYILSGAGTMRMNEEEVTVAIGDFISLLPEGSNHQLINNGSEDLDYLCISTMIEPDITIFPDSNKVIAFAGSGPGGDKSARTFNGIYKVDSTVGYYEDE